jgi:hypothetical protein
MPDLAATVARRSWQVPAYSAPAKEIREWSMQQVSDGRAYQESSPGFEQLEKSVQLLAGRPSSALAKLQQDGYSMVHTNRLKRNLREMVNSLSEIRWQPGFSSQDAAVHGAIDTLNKVGNWWYSSQFIDLKIKRAIQWVAISPGGWLEVCYRQIPGSRGRRVIDVIPRSWFDVVMTGVPESGDYQEAYTVTIIKDFPMYLAHATWPEHQARLLPDRETPNGWWERLRDKAAEVAHDVFSDTPQRETAHNPTVRLYYQYVIDLSINRTGRTMQVGYRKGRDGILAPTEWSYDVPSLGTPILSGLRDAMGTPQYKMATDEDARIFPGRRLIVCAENLIDAPLYDGPSFDWHGMAPLVKLGADSWPFGDFSMVHDMANVQETINEVERIVHQRLRNKLDPNIFFNNKALTNKAAKSLSVRIQGKRIGYDGERATANNIASTPLADSEIEKESFQLIEYLVGEMDFETGVDQHTAMSKMKGGNNPDAMQDFLAKVGPIVKGISRDMERAFRDMTTMFAWLVYQYMTTPQIMTVVGVDGVTAENYDYNPGSLIVSHLPGEDKSQPSAFSNRKRAEWSMDHLAYTVLPGTLHEITQTSQKLLTLQLWRGGGGPFPIDPQTVAEALRLGDWGKVEGNTILDRWRKWQDMELERQLAMKVRAKELLGDDAGDAGGGQPGTHAGGRKPTGQAAPSIGAKGDGRPVTKESK